MTKPQTRKTLTAKSTSQAPSVQELAILAAHIAPHFTDPRAAVDLAWNLWHAARDKIDQEKALTKLKKQAAEADAQSTMSIGEAMARTGYKSEAAFLKALQAATPPVERAHGGFSKADEQKQYAALSDFAKEVYDAPLSSGEAQESRVSVAEVKRVIAFKRKRMAERKAKSRQIKMSSDGKKEQPDK
jgi:hypothetical protein